MVGKLLNHQLEAKSTSILVSRYIIFSRLKANPVFYPDSLPAYIPEKKQRKQTFPDPIEVFFGGHPARIASNGKILTWTKCWSFLRTSQNTSKFFYLLLMATRNPANSPVEVGS